MSVSIHWQAVNSTIVPTNLPSATCTALGEAFGGLPAEIGPEAFARLEGMIAAADDPEPYLAIRKAIEENGTIRIWAAW